MKRYAAVFFTALLAFGIVSCDDSGGGKDTPELVGTWVRTLADGTDTMYIFETSGMTIVRVNTTTTGSANFPSLIFDDENNHLKAVNSSTNDIFEDYWAGGNQIYYFTYTVENDELYYVRTDSEPYPDVPETWVVGPYVKQPSAE